LAFLVGAPAAIARGAGHADFLLENLGLGRQHEHGHLLMNGSRRRDRRDANGLVVVVLRAPMHRGCGDGAECELAACLDCLVRNGGRVPLRSLRPSDPHMDRRGMQFWL
jgi:hypothetical protein